MQDVDYLELLTEPPGLPTGPDDGPQQPPPGRWQTLAQVGKYFGNVTWLWPSWIPRGHLTLVAGPQGTGKSYFAAHLMAVLIGAFSEWPDGAPCEEARRHVLLVETEEMRQSYWERMGAMGANTNRVYLPGEDPTEIPILPRDLRRIAELAMFTDAGLIVVDSLSGGHTLDENSSEMRRLLQGLSGLAVKLGVPILVVHHLRKKSALEPDKPTLDRVRGSSTISQFCRSVLACWRPSGGPDGPVRVEPLKCSFCKPPQPFGFEITDAGLLRFTDAPEEDRPGSERERAEAFLLELLRDGPLAAAKVYEDGRLAGYNERTLRRAKDSLAVQTVNRNGKWYWSLPYKGDDCPV